MIEQCLFLAKMNILENKQYIIAINYLQYNDIIDISKFLPCDKCREKYGECSEETSDCEIRFLEFCEEEAP